MTMGLSTMAVFCIFGGISLEALVIRPPLLYTIQYESD